jgi:signal transduction histidine kinase
MHPRLKLQWRVLVLITGGMGLTLLLSSYFHGLITRSLIEDDRYNTAVSQVVALTERIVAREELRTPEALRKNLAVLSDASRDFQQIDVYQDTGTGRSLVASTAPGAPRLPALDESSADNDLHEMDHPLPDVVTIEVLRGGVRYWIITNAVRERGRTDYVTALVLKNSDNPLIRRLQLQHDAVIGCAIIVCVGFSYLLFLQFFRRPARDIVTAMTQARGGNFEARTGIRRRDELGEIADGFNAMMDDLSGRDREREALLARISHFNEELQDEVGRATGELRSAHAELFESQQRLSRSERLAAMGQVAASLAHEIGTPLNSISGHVQLLARRLSGDRDAQRRVGIITQQLDSIVGSVRTLLHRAQKTSLQLKPVDLRTLVTELLHLVGPTLDSHGIKPTIAVDPKLPRVMADADSLRQVLLNLINNSVDAMSGGGRLEIRAKPNNSNQFAEITVQDTGPGLAPEIVEHLFEPMWTTKPTGSGFGLSIARDIMAQHGGSIEGDLTASGGGAVFIVRIPLASPTNPSVKGAEVHHGA